MPKTVKNEFLSAINMDNNVTKEDEEKSINDNFLYSKIATFEKRQTYQKVQIEILTHLILIFCVIFYLKFASVCV